MSDVTNRSCATQLESLKKGRYFSSLHILLFLLRTLCSWAVSVLFGELIWCCCSQVELPGETYVFHWSLRRTGAEGGLCLPCLIRELLGLFVLLCTAHVCTQREQGMSEEYDLHLLGGGSTRAHHVGSLTLCLLEVLALLPLVTPLIVSSVFLVSHGSLARTEEHRH